VLMPCGAGKTVVGVAVAVELSARTLVVTPSREVGEQWQRHFLEMTTLTDPEIALFDALDREATVSILTYQGLTVRRDGTAERLIDALGVPWGLVIYDEVHSLPADVFRLSASLQSLRRLGLTATLVREDGRQRDVFALVGPPVWQAPWRELERQGWIAPVECVEVRVRLGDEREATDDRRLAAKFRVLRRLLERHEPDRVLIAAHRLREVNVVARRLGIPCVTGETPQRERARLYDAFRRGEINRLVLSRVANVGVDLPDANVLVQISGAFGSRLEEAQRVGRLLRPKAGDRPARFYSLVSPDTREAEHAARRQRFLIDQGYRYRIVNTSA
jgi:DNA excision repair protein ERCC-3